MINPEWLTDNLQYLQIHKDLQESIIRDITRRILKTNFTVTDTAAWQAEKLQQTGLLYDDVIKEISKRANTSTEEIRKAFAEAKTEVFNYPDEDIEKAGYIPKEFKNISPAMSKILNASYKNVTKEIRNLTGTTAITSQNMYINACDLAHMQIVSGAFDYKTAIKNAVLSASKQSLNVIYESGHTTSLDAAVRRAVLTGVNQTAGKLQLMRADEMQIDIMEISAHSGARPEHAEWQGKLVSRSGAPGYLTLEDIGYGTARGFMGANCRHGWHIFFVGISKQMYTPAQLEDMKSKTVTYEDTEMPLWQARDKQRSIERSIKETKQQLVAIDEAIKNVTTEEEKYEWLLVFNNLSVNLKTKEAKLYDFCTKTGIKRDLYREQVFAVKTENGIKGWAKQISNKAVYEAQGYYDYWRKSIGAKNTPETLEKYYKMKYNDKAEYSRLRKYALSVKKGEVTTLLGYKEYRDTALKIENNLIGVKTLNGIVIKDYSAHFVSRVIGNSGLSQNTNRTGVDLKDIKDALINGKLGKTQICENGDISIKFIGNKCEVAVNPNKKMLIQTNPN